MKLLHTGVFATPEEVRYATSRVHHADAAVSMLMQKPALPWERVNALCESYGLPFRDDGAHFAICPESNELLYAWP